MKRRSSAAAALGTVLSELRQPYDRACDALRVNPDGYGIRYRRERRRLFGLALRAVEREGRGGGGDADTDSSGRSDQIRNMARRREGG